MFGTKVLEKSIHRLLTSINGEPAEDLISHVRQICRAAAPGEPPYNQHTVPFIRANRK